MIMLLFGEGFYSIACFWCSAATWPQWLSDFVTGCREATAVWTKTSTFQVWPLKCCLTKHLLFSLLTSPADCSIWGLIVLHDASAPKTCPCHYAYIVQPWFACTSSGGTDNYMAWRLHCSTWTTDLSRDQIFNRTVHEPVISNSKGL